MNKFLKKHWGFIAALLVSIVIFSIPKENKKDIVKKDKEFLKINKHK